jgi:hypothetical protein
VSIVGAYAASVAGMFSNSVMVEMVVKKDKLDT